MLAHLAECEECRDAVFLMRGPEKTPDAQEAAPREWIWRRWLLPAGLAAAAVACGLTVMLVHVSSHRGVGESGQIAVVQKPESPKNENATAPTGSSAPAAQSEEGKGSPQQGKAAPHTVRQER